MSKVSWAEQIIHIWTLNAHHVSLLKQVEIHPGTGVMVEKLAWAYALNANSATVFVRDLLTAVFPVEIPLVSNLRGGKRDGGDARLPLDKDKLDAIYSMFSSFYVMCFANSPCFFCISWFQTRNLKEGRVITSYQHSTVPDFSASCVELYGRCMENMST